ncbi:MAG TPA: DJ-1/PfpI family protein [Hyphomicrobiaceae bacterium]|jgi:cyclohexyl-isocyanide hydratase|nr:DJ-1/PfpI family protein [Hyphomicrobiaceae bacterium]
MRATSADRHSPSHHSPPRPFRIGFLVFPSITQLDMTGPHEVFARMAGAEVHLVWKTLDPVAAQGGMRLVPSTRLDVCPQLDLICVPGGPGTTPLLNDAEVLTSLRAQAAAARYVTAVCTGSLVLGAAGLLRGRRATTHWTAHHLLSALGAVPVAQRVVIDGNVITGGGVTAGIDFALQVVAEVAGEEAARAIQLGIEYDPQPPFDAGSPQRAGEALVARQRQAGAQVQAAREAAVHAAARRLGGA